MQYKNLFIKWRLGSPLNATIYKPRYNKTQQIQQFIIIYIKHIVVDFLLFVDAIQIILLEA